MLDVLSFLDAAADTVAGLDGRAVAVALALQAANLVLRSLAWRNVLAAAYPSRRIPLVGVGASYAVGVALNGFLPARGGEAAKIALVRTQLPGSSVITIAASGGVLLMLDAAIGLGLLTWAWSLGAVPTPALPAPGPSATTVGVVAVLGSVLAVAAAPFARRRVVRRVAGLGRRALTGASVLRDPRRYLRSVASLQVAAWVCRIGAVWALLAAFDLESSPTVAAAVVVAAGASTLLPAAPGGAGAQQLLVVYVLVHLASAADALSFAIAMQAGVTTVNAAVGIAAAMLVFRTLRPWTAVTTAVRATRR